MNECRKERYIDSGNALGAFCDKIYCRCPRCDGQAIITADIEYKVPLWFNSAKVLCLQCTFHQKWTKGKLYNRVVGSSQQRCPNCGHKWLRARIESEAGKRLSNKQSVICPTCNQRVAIDLKWSIEWQGDLPVDPYFGYDLWLQAECCGKILWVYNENHLQTLRSYIEARIRDGRYRGKWSMITRLPHWVKAAKNRDCVVKSINTLEKRLKQRRG